MSIMNFERAEDDEQIGTSKSNSPGQQSWRGGSADPDPHLLNSVPALREQLMSRDHELKVARRELSYTSSIISTLRDEIVRADKEKAAFEDEALSARDVKVHAEAEANALRQQISARNRMLDDLRSQCAEAEEIRDAREAECRDLNSKLEKVRLSGLLDMRRAETKAEAIQEELAACKKAKVSLSSRVNRMEIELRESAAKVTALESQLQLAAEREKDMKLEARKREDEFSAVEGGCAGQK